MSSVVCGNVTEPEGIPNCVLDGWVTADARGYLSVVNNISGAEPLERP